KTARPLLPAKWDKAEMATMSFGHGISVTPLQVITAANALVNGGYYLQPSFTPVDQQSFKSVPIISEETSAKMRKLMYRVVEEGTGQKVKIEGLKIGGKTGTSEKNINGRYEKDKLVNWFVVSFPIENPSYTLLVMIDEPKALKEDWNLKTSAWNAVPITKQILKNILPFLEITLEKKEPSDDETQ
ncbi:MAG: penicillin-binding protein 2, partial [Alphaproteobacteria bacterium]|nr:penicillin-binding protein 2 [Alphaproteobacteria bacterium]